MEVSPAETTRYKLVASGPGGKVEWPMTETVRVRSESEMAHDFLTGTGGEQNIQRALAYFQKAAEKGDADAQFWAGDILYHGRTNRRDYTGARQWFERAADAGHPYALFHLADMLENGTGVPKDEQRANELYRRAFTFAVSKAQKGDALAQEILGYCYEYGKGTTLNMDQAWRWMSDAAKQDSWSAQTGLGAMYYRMQPPRLQEARYWFEKAAAKGDSSAQGILSILCFLGQGGKRDLEAARAWALKAAQQGNSTGRGLLAYIYETGQGVDKDLLEAYKWCLLAEALGEKNADAEAVRKRLDTSLNTSQKAEARKRADEWQKTYGPQ
jgi:hypothetical protein